MKKVLALITTCFILAGCAATPPQKFTVNDFSGEEVINLAAGQLDIKSVAMRSDRSPHIEYKMPMRPEEALSNWANNRYTALSMSSPLTVKIVIKDASMFQEEQPIDSWYTYDNVKYRLTYSVAFKIEKNGVVMHSQDVNGWEEAAIPQKSTIAEKEKVWEKMFNNMVKKVDAKINNDLPKEYVL